MVLESQILEKQSIFRPTVLLPLTSPALLSYYLAAEKHVSFATNDLANGLVLWGSRCTGDRRLARNSFF